MSKKDTVEAIKALIELRKIYSNEPYIDKFTIKLIDEKIKDLINSYL
jgi:hypothetical protein